MNTPTSGNNLLSITVIGITLLLVLLSVVSINYTNRMVSEYSTLVETSIEIKQELSIAHLWFEELISGMGSITIATSNVNLDSEEAKQLNLPQGDYVRLSFSDSGIGMDKKTLVKIFDPFLLPKVMLEQGWV